MDGGDRQALAEPSDAREWIPTGNPAGRAARSYGSRAGWPEQRGAEPGQRTRTDVATAASATCRASTNWS